MHNINARFTFNPTNNDTMNKQNSNQTTSLKKGDTVTYTKEIMFKGTIKVTAKVVAITDRKILLDNGDQFWNLNF